MNVCPRWSLRLSERGVCLAPATSHEPSLYQRWFGRSLRLSERGVRQAMQKEKSICGAGVRLTLQKGRPRQKQKKARAKKKKKRVKQNKKLVQTKKTSEISRQGFVTPEVGVGYTYPHLGTCNFVVACCPNANAFVPLALHYVGRGSLRLSER